MTQLAEPDGPADDRLTVVPGLFSPADLRALIADGETCGAPLYLVPECTDPLDSGLWSEFQALPPGGAKITDIAAAVRSRGAITLGAGAAAGAGNFLLQNGQNVASVPLPIGLANADAWYQALLDFSPTCHALPTRLAGERSRLTDALVDSHKYLAGTRVAIVGEPDLVEALVAFSHELGLDVVLAASGSRRRDLEHACDVPVLADTDYGRIEAGLREVGGADLLLGLGRAAATGRQLNHSAGSRRISRARPCRRRASAYRRL